MLKAFISIINLSIDEKHESLNIFPNELLDKEFDEYFISKVGTIEMSKFSEDPIYFSIIDKISIDLELYNHNLGMRVEDFILVGLWLVKDSTCFSPVSFIYNLETSNISRNIRNRFASNSKGEKGKTSFSKKELDEAFTRFNSYESLLPNISYASPKSENGNITGSFAMTDYNLFSNIQRSMAFILQARTTTLIPSKISWYIVALEAIFGNGENGDLTFKMSYRIPHFFEISSEDKNELSKIIKTGYNIRSKYLHGDKLNKKQHTQETQKEISSALDTLLRNTFNLIIDSEQKRAILCDPKIFSDYFHNKLIE